MIFDWNGIDVDDIGAHQLEVRATSWYEETDPADNTARATFLIQPNDWATQVRGDRWDMTEAPSPSPPWHTNDIDSMSGWMSTYSDSISGMFEGTVSGSHLSDNKMYLELDGETIDGDNYVYFSLIAKTQRACDVFLGWKDSHNQTGSLMVGELNSEWGRMEIKDLSSNWSGLDIKELWLSFRPTGMIDMPVRVGWIKLENGTI